MNIYAMNLSTGEKTVLKKLEKIIDDLDIKVRCQLCPEFKKRVFDT